MYLAVERHDVERIARDVLTYRGLLLSQLRVESIDGGWRVTVANQSGSAITTDVPSGRPASVRAMLNKWLDGYV